MGRGVGVTYSTHTPGVKVTAAYKNLHELLNSVHCKKNKSFVIQGGYIKEENGLYVSTCASVGSL
jgi:hypothetical protein